MSVAVTTAATTASIIASQNAQREHERKVHECSLYVEGFEHNQASVEQIQLYTECAELLYPQPMSEQNSVVGKVCVAALILSLVIGIIYGWRDNGFEGAALFGFIFPVGLVAILFVIALVLMGVGFLLS